MKVPNDDEADNADDVSLSRLQNEGSQHIVIYSGKFFKSIKATE